MATVCKDELKRWRSNGNWDHVLEMDSDSQNYRETAPTDARWFHS